MGWRVEKQTKRGWKFVGIVETNFEYASWLWEKIGKKLKAKYRLVAEK